ncbi:MAG TPA: sigma-70 family RNA polymerase sigma factor [Ruminiclostridium sp.]
MNFENDVKAAKQDDKEAFLRIIKKHEASMYRITKSILKNEQDCQDAIQNTIIKAYLGLHSLRQNDYFKTWLIRILINEGNIILKKQKKEVSLSSTLIDFFRKGKFVYEGTYEFDDVENIDLHEALKQLDKELKTIVILYYFEDFEIKQIARITGIPEGTVKSRLSRARKKLKEKLYSEAFDRDLTRKHIEIGEFYDE